MRSRVAGLADIKSEKAVLVMGVNQTTRNFVSGAWTVYEWDTISIDTHGCFSSGTTFTSPRAGFFLFTFNIDLRSSSPTSAQIYGVKKNAESTRLLSYQANDAVTVGGGSILLKLEKGDTCQFIVQCNGTGPSSLGAATHNQFSIVEM